MDGIRAMQEQLPVLLYFGLPALRPVGHRRASDVLKRSRRFSHMGVKTGLSGTKFLPFERPELCEGLGIHFVKVDCGISIAR